MNFQEHNTEQTHTHIEYLRIMKEGVPVIDTASSKVTTPRTMKAGLVPCLTETEK